MDKVAELVKQSLEIPSKKEVTLENGEVLTLPCLEVERLTLYHGTGKSGIQEFIDSEAATVGSGVYMTSSYDSASRYGLLRTVDERNRHSVYETEIQNMNILDLTNAESWIPLGKLMAPELEKKLQRTDFPPDWKQYHKDSYLRKAKLALERIKNDQVRGPKDILFGSAETARRKFSELGFDGIKAIEGGEGWRDDLGVGNHDTYVIFDPKKVKIIREAQEDIKSVFIQKSVEHQGIPRKYYVQNVDNRFAQDTITGAEIYSSGVLLKNGEVLISNEVPSHQILVQAEGKDFWEDTAAVFQIYPDKKLVSVIVNTNGDEAQAKKLGRFFLGSEFTIEGVKVIKRGKRASIIFD
jgi:hypothetical protein